MNRRRSVLGLALAGLALLCVHGGPVTVAASPRSATNAAPQQQRKCRNEQGGDFSTGALRRVSDQIQRCSDGTWTFDPDDPPPNAATLAKQKACRSTDARDKDQAYASGLLRAAGATSETFARCADGKWVAK